jgi:two-component system, NarL family, nitrate/nitrite response regulator NarL
MTQNRPTLYATQVELTNMANRCVSVVIAAHQPVVLCGLLTLVRTGGDFDVVATCRDGMICVQAIRDLSPDLALLDSCLPEQSALRVLSTVKSEQLNTKVALLCASSDDSSAENLIGQGACCVLSRDASPEVLVSSLRQVVVGTSLASDPESRNGKRCNRRGAAEDPADPLATLTERERQIMSLVCEGLSNKDIGRHFNLSDGTVKVHLHHIYEKLAIHNRTALAVLAAGSSQAWRSNGAQAELQASEGALPAPVVGSTSPLRRKAR